MHRNLVLLTVVSAGVALASEPVVPAAPPFTPSPVIEWGRPLDGPPLRVVCLLQGAKEEGYELLRRFNFDGQLLLGESGKYGVKSGPSSLARKRLAAGDVDVFVIGGIYWKSLPATLRLAILESVEKGMGLLLVDCHPNWWDTTLPKVMAASPAREAAAAVTSGIPLDLLPLVTLDPGRNAYCLYPDADHPAPTPEQLVTAAHFGKGRVCILNYSTAQSNVVYLYSLTPGVRVPNAPFARPYPYWEYCHSLLGKAIRWCGSGSASFQLAAVAGVEGRRVARVTVSSPVARTFELAAEIRDRFHNAISSTKARLILPADQQKTWDVTFPEDSYLPPEGLYFVNVWAKQDGKVLDWATATGEAPAPAKIAALTLDRPRYAREEPVQVGITCEGALDGAKLQVRLVGNDGRVLASQSLPAKPMQTLTLSLAAAQTLVSRVVAELRTGERTLSREQAAVFLAPGPPQQFFAYSWIDGEAYYMGNYCRRLIDQGVDGALAGGGAATYYFQGGREAVENNLRLVPTNVTDSRLGKAPDGDPAKLPRPLTDPTVIAEETRRLRTNVPIVAPMQPLGYSLMDEWALGWNDRPTDYSDASLKAFRQWLRGVYPDLAGLNAEWGAQFASWDDATPLQVKDVPKGAEVGKTNLAPFVDYRLFMDTVGPTAFGGFAQTIREMDPGAPVGLCGTESNGTWYGYEWYQLCQALDFICGYGDAAAEPIISRGMRGLQRELQRSFRRPGTLLSCWVGYHATPLYRDLPLKLLLHDFQGIAYFAGMPEAWADFPYQNYDFTLSDRALASGAGTDELRQGLDQLLWHSRRDHCGVALLISPPSQHVASALRQEGPWGEAVVALARALEDNSLQYDFIAPQQLAAGVLAERQYRVLLLPQVTCLSDAEIKAVQAFLAAGGKVAFDRAPGVLDEHGKPRAAAPQLAGALDLGPLPADRQECQEDLTKRLPTLGLQPLAKVEQSSGEVLPTETIRYFSGDHELVSLQTDWMDHKQPEPEAKIALPREGFVYDVREGKALGKTRTVTAKLDPYHILLYAILPYEVRGLSVAVPPNLVRAASSREAVVSIALQASAKPGTHYLRLTLQGPDGKPRPGFARTVVAENGVGQTKLLFAVNDPPGAWKLTARDAETGVTGTATLQLN